jgi:hypothetical protein
MAPLTNIHRSKVVAHKNYSKFVPHEISEKLHFIGEIENSRMFFNSNHGSLRFHPIK